MHLDAGIQRKCRRRHSPGKQPEGIDAMNHLHLVTMLDQQVCELSNEDRVTAEVFGWKEGGEKAKAHVSTCC